MEDGPGSRPRSVARNCRTSSRKGGSWWSTCHAPPRVHRLHTRAVHRRRQAAMSARTADRYAASTGSGTAPPASCFQEMFRQPRCPPRATWRMSHARRRTRRIAETLAYAGPVSMAAWSAVKRGCPLGRVRRTGQARTRRRYRSTLAAIVIPVCRSAPVPGRTLWLGAPPPPGSECTLWRSRGPGPAGAPPPYQEKKPAAH
jgi:hypothetical protein